MEERNNNMTYENEEKLIKVIASACRLEMDEAHIAEILGSDNCNIIEQLGFDSLLMVELVVELEETFDFEFDMNALDINKLKYYEELKNSIDSYVGEK